MNVRKSETRSSNLAALAGLIASCILLSCAPTVAPSVDPATWQAIREALEVERRSRPAFPWAAGVMMTMYEPRTGRAVDGRGAIAVAPGRALRMILVGAAGATMLDAWVTPDHWRIAVPPAGLLRRGDDPTPPGGQKREEPRELPVGFLRWVFFRPLAGTLFGGSLRSGHVLFLLRDDDAVVEVRLGGCNRGELTMTTRRVHGRSERLEECRASGAPTSGDWVRYEDESSGLRVALTIESLTPGAPEEEAFRDPERSGT
jgi:hypothetical protein